MGRKSVVVQIYLSKTRQMGFGKVTQNFILPPDVNTEIEEQPKATIGFKNCHSQSVSLKKTQMRSRPVNNIL